MVAPEIGFTGTQEGMSEKQRSSLRQVLADFFADGARVFRHGDCIGADAQAHAIAKATGGRRAERSLAATAGPTARPLQSRACSSTPGPTL